MQIEEQDRTAAEPLVFGEADDDDDPWEEFDPEAEAPELEPQIASFGAMDLADTTTFERWLQSALRALVAPDLGVDGKPGPRTTAAIKRFQTAAERLRGRGPLRVDGVAGPATIAALAELTGVDAPTLREGAAKPAILATPDPAPPLASTGDPATITVREQGTGDAVEYVLTADGDEVRFSYWSRSRRDYRPFAISRYRGARRGLLSDEDILAVGYSTSELGILRANSLKESGGTFGALNTWDNQIVSWGMAQFAGHAGTLANLLWDLRESPRTAAAYARWFRSQGVDVDDGPYPYGAETRRGVHVVVRDGDVVHRGDRGWEHVRRTPRLVGAFLLAGNDPAIQLGQVIFWRRAMLGRAYRKVIGRSKGGGRVCDFLTAERSVAIVVRLYNWMPAYVVQWCDRFLDEFAAAHPGRAVHDPRAWDQALEDAFVERIAHERRTQKKGDYADYALGLARARARDLQARRRRRRPGLRRLTRRLTRARDAGLVFGTEFTSSSTDLRITPMTNLKPTFYYPHAGDPNAAPAAAVVDVKLRPNSRFGKVLEFNGTSSMLSLGLMPGMDAVTIAFWVRKFVSQGGASPGLDNPVCTIVRNLTLPRVDFVDSVTVPGGGSITTNQDLIQLDAGWSHVTVVFHFQFIRLFVRGELRQQKMFWTREATWTAKQSRVWIGRNILSNSFFMGQIAQLEVFPLALSMGDILELAKPRPPTPLLHVPLGVWSYDETKKNSRLNDATGKAVAVIEGKPTLVPDQAFDQCLRVDSGQFGPLSFNDMLVPAYGTVAVWSKISRNAAPGSSPLLHATAPSKPQEQLWRVLAPESTQWVHYALVREQDEFDPLLVREKVYKDGQLLDDRGSFYENSPTERGLREPAKGRFVLGQGLVVDLAHLMIFDVALSPGGLQQLIHDTRLLPTTDSIPPVRQKRLSLGGKDGNIGSIAATTGQEIFGVTADIYVRGRNPDSYSSRTTDLIVDGRSVGPIRLHRSSEEWLLCQKNLDLTPFAAGLPTIDVGAPGAGDGFEIEIRYDTLERPAKRQHTLTLRQRQEATLPARPGSVFVSGRADVYLRPLYELPPEIVAWFIGGFQRYDRTAAKPGVWTLIDENVDLTNFVKYQRSLAVASRDVELRLKLDLEQLQVGQSKGVVEIHDARRSANILAPADHAFRAGTANLYIRGGLGGKAEYLNVYVGGSYVGRFSGQGTADWRLVRENIALSPAVDGLQNVELTAYPAGSVVQADSCAAATWGLRLEYDFATSFGQATRTGAKVEAVEVYESGAKGWSFKGSGPCHLVFQVGHNRQLRGGSFTARMNGGRELSSLRLVTDKKVYVVGPGAQPVIQIFDGINSVQVATFKIEPDNHRAPYEFGIDCQFQLHLGFDWYWNDELRRRIAVMRTNTDEIRARVRTVDSVLEYTVEKLDLSRKINDGLKDLDNGLATVHSLLGLAALIPPIKTAVQRMRDVVDGFHASVKRAREASDSVEKAIKPIREALAENEKRTTKVLQICAHVVRMEAWSLIVVEGAKNCVTRGEYTDAKITAARALESVCKGVVPIVEGFDSVQRGILEPCIRVENAVRSMREEIDRLGSLEAAIRRVHDELEPLLDTLKKIEEKLNSELWGISVKKILDGIDGLIEPALGILRPIFDKLNFNLSFDLPGLDDLERWGLGLAADFKMFEVEWGMLAGLALKWETGFVDFEKQIDEVKKQYEKCCLCAPPTPGDAPYVILHQHANYDGTPLSFGPGKYNLDTANDMVSSVQVPAGLKLTLYEHRDWQGAARVFTSNAPYVGDDFNDRASSLIVEYT